MERGSVDTRIFVRGIETQRLIETIREKMEQGIDLIPYADLDQAAGGSVQNERRGNLTSAIKIIQKDDRVLWECERMVGIRRCRGAEVIGSAKRDYSRCRSAARKALGKLAVGEYETFRNEDKITHNALAAALGAISQFSKESAVKRISSTMHSNKPVQPRLTDVLALFQGERNGTDTK